MLSPSERIHLIEGITARLEHRDYTHIDMVLGQFDVTGTHESYGTERQYLLQSLKDAPSGSLLGLGKHFKLVEATPGNNTKIWAEGHFRLFISHLAAHREEAAEVRTFLGYKSISAFVAHNDIHPTEEWQEVILEALASCDAMAVLLRDGFHASSWTDQEIGFALARRVLIIPVRLGVDPYGFIGRFQGLNGRGKSAGEIAGEIAGILTAHRLSARRMAETLVFHFERSGSFAGARANAKALLNAAYWDASFTQRCEAAYESNDQINEINGVRSSLNAVYAKWSK